MKSTAKFLFITSALILVVSLFAYGAAWIWYDLQKPDEFRINHVLVRGRLTHVTPVQVAGIVQQYVTGNFFSLNVSSVKAHLLEIPWVTQVSFRRVWPHTLVTEITEQTAVARVGDRGVLNVQGKVFYPDLHSIPANLPVLSAPLDQMNHALQLFHELTAIAHSLALSIQSLTLTDDQNWTAQLSNGVVIVLGADDVLSRFQRLMRVYTKLAQTSKRSIARIDLRYSNGFAVAYQS